MYLIYGDAAYPELDVLFNGRLGPNATQEQKAFVKFLNKCRTCTEWGFGKVCTLFAFLNNPKALKMLKMPLGKIYDVCVILTNCHTSYYGSVSGSYFNCPAPSVQDYLNV